ncbi:hypothetical protein G7074_06245 [Pedobacter sp. HDW13]|uniref:hypothetical protein n=1 Tax=unclassified Pedobacter TaxID=2628915 RepID=UPI000F5A7400|nr:MULTISPECIES: hypothetical protein [unclassified Pedobacter]QIL38914.1 hypothetical protein G7074_06245 [Pedobacter sp. HDW13]RQO72559.1 hypothetical protein DBR40_14715 [Pedobacter sp. KBW01]
MPEDYRKVVFEAYQKKKRDGSLSSNLMEPTPGNLREECIIVCRERYVPEDHEILRLFFSNVDCEKGYLTTLEKSLAKEFKQTSNVLKGGVKKPGIKYFELLAWLIGFHPKTSTAYYMELHRNSQKEIEDKRRGSISEKNTSTNAGVETNVNTNEGFIHERKDVGETSEEKNDDQQDGEGKNEVDISKEEGEDKADDEEKDKRKTLLKGGEDSKDGAQKNDETSNGVAGHQQNGGENDDGGSLQGEKNGPKPPVSTLFKVACSFIILFVVSTSYWFWKNNEDKAIHTAKSIEQCMYWTGQHYEPINCDNNDLNKLKIPLNKEQLEHQQRITMPDTLTNYALGMVWYGKVNGSIDKTPQFYTDSGTNPLDTTRRLLPVTTYMLNKYVSYERHLLNTLVWTASLLVLFSLLITLAYKTRPKAAPIK